MTTDLQTELKSLGGIFKMRANRLGKLGLITVYDLLTYKPKRYEDRSTTRSIADSTSGENVTIEGIITDIKNIYTKNRKQIQEAKISDNSGELNILWFNQPYLLKSIHRGEKISIFGKIERIGYEKRTVGPDYEIIQDKTHPHLHTGRIVPIYAETKGLSSKWIRRAVYILFNRYKKYLEEYLPESLRKDYELSEYSFAIEHLHFPDNIEEALICKKRLAFDELLFLQLSAMERRKEWEQEKNTFPLPYDQFKNEMGKFFSLLPFTLTDAQKKCISQIFSDVIKTKPMNRMLQGDVGSGKTVVAASAMYLAFLNGYKSIFMTPTEILAEQHFKTISGLLTPLRVKVELITGSKKGIGNRLMRKEKRKTDLSPKPYILNADIFVGTHALLSKKLKFDKVALIVIDEQQRFGVEQRATLKQKSGNTHLLTMTATPIPRTVALTLYGDLDLSFINEMPKNRKPIKTWLVPNEKRESGYKWIEKQIRENRDQAFIVCPFIEESESMATVKAATVEFERLQQHVFPNLKLGLLHGKIKPNEKENILSDFKNKEIDILVATPVVEVGIDFPNATIIVIEGAERFGLAQLHQMRGRVGRGDKQSYCLLYTESLNPETRARLHSLEKIHTGSELAEIDFKLRGPGDMYGTAQSGYNILKIASFSDAELIEKSRQAADELFPNLDKYPKLKGLLEKIERKHISQD